MSLLDLPVRRPVAVAMVFLGIVMLGGVAWQRMPVELFPALEGDRLFVNFIRPGSEPQVVEREILLPLQARVSALPMVSETWGEVRGSFGSYQVRFERGADVKVRELELQRVAAAIEREQPRGTSISVNAFDTSAFSSFVMMVHVLGGDAAGDGAETDQNALHDLVEEIVAPRFASVAGVAQAIPAGGAGRQVTLAVDLARAAAMGVTTDEVTQAVNRNVDRLRYLGNLEAETGRTDVVLDGRPPGLYSLGQARIHPDRPLQLRHVGEIEFGSGREESQFRVNAQPAVGLILFQEEGANLVRLGRKLRVRADEVREELLPMGLDVVIGFDAAELVEEQISRLAKLGLSGFGIALVVLFLFLRQWRAVAVVGVAVPVSLFAALALLYLFGETLNIITLFGLAFAVGLLVDNSVVVYEAVQRRLEHGASPEQAARDGVHRTVRAIGAASLTTAVVFLPLTVIEFDDTLMRELIVVVALAILLPLGASLLVAVGLVPLLAHRLAAPAAVRHVARNREKRRKQGGLIPPDRARILFTGLVSGALRHPPAWLAGTIFTVMITVIVALPWVVVDTASQEAPEADSIQLVARFKSGRGSLEAASGAVQRLERAVLEIEGVETVESFVQEDGGSITINLVDEAERPPNLSAARVRQVAHEAAREVDGLQILRPGEEELGGRGGGDANVQAALGSGPAKVVLSGPDSADLERLALDVRLRLDSIPQIQRSWMSVAPGIEEIWVEPNRRAFEAFGLTLDQVLPTLALAGREGERIRNGFVLRTGRELPMVVERTNARANRGAQQELSRLRLQTEAGVVPIAALASMRRMPAPPTIVHHNGRREMEVLYRLSDGVPETGPTRLAIEEQIASTIRSVPRPRGFTVEVSSGEETTNWFRRILVPVVLLLFLVLAMTFESLTLPVLVLLALPLTLLGATWALVFAGMPLSMMALLGALALFGLTVNPAILLVDRMQQKVLGAGWSPGAAALASVRERTRPVLMTTATTVAGLWPLALATGRENEIWPPFATIVMGGLVTSTLLTLLIIPVGFILLQKLDTLFARVGPWLVVAWLGSTVGIMTTLIVTETLTSLLWQIVSSLLVGGVLLAVAVFVFRRVEVNEPDTRAGPPVLEVRHLRKVYGVPGPIRRAIQAPKDFAAKVVATGGSAFDPRDAVGALLPALLLGSAFAALALNVQGGMWRLFYWLLVSACGVRFLHEIRRARGKVNAAGAVDPGGLEGLLAAVVPWAVLGAFTWVMILAPRIAGGDDLVSPFWPIAGSILLAIGQLARRSAVRQSRGLIEERVDSGALRYPRTLLRRIARRLGGLDLPSDPVLALAAVSFRVEKGMIGILGPNGAGKTTLLRQLAGILDPTRGTISLGGVPLRKVQKVLARWVGYLPQDAGLPGSLSPKEYLSYFAALYDLEPGIRAERVDSLLSEVGLSEKADTRIKELSGGMRQRVAVARTLLRLPSIIIVDEPTVGLDPRERIRFRNLLARLARDRIVLFSTHVVEDVAVACERVLVMARGRLTFDGAPEALANVAHGKVWETRGPAEEEAVPVPGSILAEETPGVDGTTVRRILAESAPVPDAKPLDSSLEDGYLWLLEQAHTGGIA
ncbi:MAG: efflux RND transporter permease subunit [Acidobacteriota bacterium]|nr:efflux RND transporter permease subunit [Acidobacteriota bacterium]